MRRALSCLLLAVAAALVAATTSRAALQAPGRVVFTTPELTSFTAGTALADGRVVLAGAGTGVGRVVRLDPSGALDPSFGAAGVARLPANESGALQVLDRGGRRLLVVVAGTPAVQYDRQVIDLVGLTSGGELDPQFG